MFISESYLLGKSKNYVVYLKSSLYLSISVLLPIATICYYCFNNVALNVNYEL